ncbi:M20/M25/M40 family metallo-hydrolase [Aliifodinibius sp. S!AR15-10]|uniref:M20/M25/M40 family metallo-hydrolase n=1 Tax=Aliifodinibius sp. S!AR15-10 TaxID=2950437 RepID=UPI00285F3D7B|nr:M20/M25/M40 family metallo-hydrolase [Aliifodinibius sp. S!AR15-10]MDR8394017.1 M20/M25/M40 family metallo-hydrolase [Aliifodinibius sp. S!AR15-10]
MRTEWIKKVAVALFIFVSIWWGLYITSPPTPKSTGAPSTEFSAERAFEHVKKISPKPHMVGTAEHDSVKQYILNELEKLGVNPRIESGISTVNFRGYRAVETQNIIARLEGTDSERTIMLMAHYDSAIYAPGAADDGSGVAAILEVIRAVKAGNPLKNDLLVLFTDGEELGLMGARRFASTNPLLKEIDLILNLEARGSSGRSVMFETNAGNAKLIPLFAEATSHPVANSLTYSIYKILPNDTDFSVFKPHGIQGLNFAFIEGFLNYHTMQDIPENLSLASLQHHGENLIGNVRLFGNQNFNLAADSDLVYFNSPVGGLIYYPESWSHYLTGFTVLLFILILFVGYRHRWLTVSKVFWGFISYLGILIFSALITWYGWHLLEQYLFPKYQWIQHGETYAYQWYLWFFISLLAVITIPTFRWIKYKININNLLAGIYLTTIVLLITLTLYLPAANYLLLWPILFGLLGWILTANQLYTEKLDTRSLLILATSQFMLLFMIPFYIKFVQITLTTQLLAASMLLYLFMLGLLYPLIDYIVRGAPQRIYSMLGVLSIACFIGAALNSDFSPTQKKQNSLIYAHNLDTGKSYWLSTDHATDEWTSEFLGPNPSDSTFSGFPALEDESLLYSPAPSIDISSTQIDLVSNHINDSLRTVTLRFGHSHPANMVSITFSGDNQIQEIQLDGQSLGENTQSTDTQYLRGSELTFFRNSESSFTLQVTIPVQSSNMQVRTTYYSLSLPPSILQSYPQRASYMMPKPRGFSSGTMWIKTVSLEELIRDKGNK